MHNELEELYNMLVSQTDIMKKVDKHIERQIEYEMRYLRETTSWQDYERKRDRYVTVAETAKRESFMAGFNYAVRLFKGSDNT